MHFHRMLDQECSFQIMNSSLRVTPAQLVLTVLGLTVCQRDPRSWLPPGLALGGLCICPVFSRCQFSRSGGLRTVLETLEWEP